MQEKSEGEHQKLAETPPYISSIQLAAEDCDTTFKYKLNSENRWVKLANAIPWKKIAPRYDRLLSNRKGGAPISGRVIIGTMFIKRLGGLTKQSAIQHIIENPYIQYFLGYRRFTYEVPFTASLFEDMCSQLPSEKLTKDIDKIIFTYCDEWNYGKDEDYDTLPF